MTILQLVTYDVFGSGTQKWFLREFDPLSGLRMYSPFILLLSPNVSVNAGFLYDKGAMHVAVITQRPCM